MRPFKSIPLRLAAAMVSVISLPSRAIAQDGAGADAQIQETNRKVLEQIRSGNRDSRQLMKIMEPALKARDEALERGAKARLENAIKEGRERRKAALKNDPKGGAKSALKGGGSAAQPSSQAAPPSGSSGGGSRYGGNSAPIVDPATIPKEITFEKKAPKPHGPAAHSMPPIPEEDTAVTGTGGVDEIEFK
jgi:hypothetical protein